MKLVAQRILILNECEASQSFHYLVGEGYKVMEVTCFDELKEVLFFDGADLIVLELELQGLSGIDICSDIRVIDAAVPIVIISSVTDVFTKVLALEKGADYYMTKPYSHRELLARFRTLLRRTEREPSEEPINKYVIGSLEICANTMKVTYGKKVIELTPIEFRLLFHLVQNKGKTLSRQELSQVIWSTAVHLQRRGIDVHISNLREKINRTFISTVYGQGYRVNEPQTQNNSRKNISH